VKVESIITHKFPLEEWKKAFDTFESGEGIKVELIP
jgi:threonine dehydrogenase-like Zn-dependent dehydrogenase